ncbi:hypothetical protein JCM16358_12610 [Halanaerocella petrolearia]
MFNESWKYLNLVILLLLTLTATTFASSSAKNLGLGSDFATVTGTDALYSNPGAVNVDSSIFTFELGVDAGLWNNLLSNDYITPKENDKLLNKIKDNGFLVSPTGKLGSKLIIGPVASSLDVNTKGLVSLSPNVAKLLLKGNQISHTYNLDTTSGAGGVYADGRINFSVEAPKEVSRDWDVENLYVGFTYHQLAGSVFKVTAVGDSTDGEETTTKQAYLMAKYNDPNQSLATGSAFDLGVYSRLNDRYSFGFSIMNIGSLTATEESTEYSKYQYDSTTEDLNEIEEGSLNQKLTWQLPTTYRFGGKMKYSENVNLLANYSLTKYYTTEDINYTDHKVAIATELMWLSFLPVRTGVNYSTLEDDLDWSAGLGLYFGPWKTDLGVSDVTGLFNQTKDLKVGITTKIEF